MSYAGPVDTSGAKIAMEKPFAQPYFAFAAPDSQVLSRARRPIPDQVVSSPARRGDAVPSEATLAWALVDVVSICFTADDRLGIYTALGAGETYSAIQRMLVIAVRRRYRLPATLIAALTGWLDCYIGNEHEPMTRGLLNRVEP